MERVYQRRLGEGGRKEKDEGGDAPMRMERNEEERKRKRGRSFNTSRGSLSLHLCSSIVQAECPPPQPLTPLRSEAPPLLHSSNAPSLHLPTPKLSDLCSAPSLAPPFSHSLPLHRSTEKWRKDETLQRGGEKRKEKKINNTDG